MFLTLLLVTFIVASVVAAVTARAFTPSIGKILRRITSDDIGGGWLRYMQFAIFVVGVSKGVRIYDLERYINPPRRGDSPETLVLTQDRWVLEIYRTVVETLEGIAWMLLWFFAVALIAFVLVRIFEARKGASTNRDAPGA